MSSEFCLLSYFADLGVVSYCRNSFSWECLVTSIGHDAGLQRHAHTVFAACQHTVNPLQKY